MERSVKKLERTVKGEGWIWLGVSFGLVLGYTIIEIADVLPWLRQILIYPVNFAYLILALFFKQFHIGQMPVPEMLDVDYGGNIGIMVRVAVFAVEVFLFMLPAYLYRKTRKIVYLCWVSVIAYFVMMALCFFFMMLWIISSPGLF